MNNPNNVASFAHGFSALWQGCKDIFRPEVRRFVIIPLIINILVFTVAFYFCAHYTSAFINHISLDFLPNWNWLLSLVKIIKIIFIFLLMLIYLVFFSFIATLSANLFACPFNSLLSEKFSRAILGVNFPPTPTNVAFIAHSITRETKKMSYTLSRFILFGIASLIFYFIPVLNLLLPVIFYCFTAWMLAIEYLDYPAENDQQLFAQTLKTLKHQKSLCLGFGLGLLLLSSIPIINLIAMPVGVLAATRLWNDLK